MSGTCTIIWQTYVWVIRCYYMLMKCKGNLNMFIYYNNVAFLKVYQEYSSRIYTIKETDQHDRPVIKNFQIPGHEQEEAMLNYLNWESIFLSFQIFSSWFLFLVPPLRLICFIDSGQCTALRNCAHSAHFLRLLNNLFCVGIFGVLYVAFIKVKC